MPRAYGSCSNTTGITTGTSAKTILQYTAPAAGAVIKAASITLNGTSSASAKIPVDLIRGATGGSGSSSVTVAARGSNNPTGPTLGTGKEGFSSEPSGGTVIQTGFAPPYGTYPFEMPQEIVLAGGETLGIRTTAPAAVDARANFSLIEC